jgi:hypothetical protein
MRQCKPRQFLLVATRGRGTVTRSNLRLAAGVGVIAAFLLVGGPGAAAAIADPGGSHSDHSDNDNRSDHRDRGDGNGGSKRGDDDRDGDNGYRGDDKKGERDSDTGQRPRTAVGSGRTATESITSDDPVAETPADRSGSDHPGASTAEPGRPPRVTFGNGRPPIVKRAEPPRESGPIEVAPSPPPPPPVVDIAPVPKFVDIQPRRFVPQLGVAPSAAVSDPLFGLAGLLLIPAAGAFLGYRQAKASQAADVLSRP